jgi:hypothetical protein
MILRRKLLTPVKFRLQCLDLFQNFGRGALPNGSVGLDFRDAILDSGDVTRIALSHGLELVVDDGSANARCHYVLAGTYGSELASDLSTVLLQLLGVILSTLSAQSARSPSPLGTLKTRQDASVAF